MGSKESGNRTSAARHGPEEIGNKDDKVIMKGPWSEEEDSILVDYIQNHGEGHWDFVARCTGLRRTGKSCRLRWLNYLRPGIRHGNFTLEEQLKILELHFLWGNRWSKIAESLNGRTDNEVKNYWRTRVHRQAKLLNCDVNGKEFGDIIRFVLMPRLAEQIRSKSRESSQAAVLVSPAISSSSSSSNINLVNMDSNDKALIMMRDHTNSLQDQWPLIQHDHRNEDGGDDQVGDEIWNDENVEFLRQQLFGHDDSDV